MSIRAGVVSTIIPVHNRAGLLAEAIESVLAQTYRPIEIIVVDDGSTDDTPAVAQAYAARHPDEIKYLRLARGREWRARNHGVAAASGEFIQFLDSDDLVAPDKLTTQVQALRAHPECGISYCYVREYAMGDPLPRWPARRTGDTFDYLFPHVLEARIWPYPSPLFRRDVIDAAGPFLDLAAYPDWELECRMGAMGVRLHHCRSFLAETRNTHKVEGRRKSGRPADTLRDVARIFEVILGHAREARVSATALNGFARRLMVAGRQCASIGLDTEARRCFELARGASTGRRHFAATAYIAASNLAGWGVVGRTSERVASGSSRWSRPVVRLAALWRHRASVAFEEVAAQPLLTWPQRLIALWLARPSRQLHRQRTP